MLCLTRVLIVCACVADYFLNKCVLLFVLVSFVFPPPRTCNHSRVLLSAVLSMTRCTDAHAKVMASLFLLAHYINFIILTFKVTQGHTLCHRLR